MNRYTILIKNLLNKSPSKRNEQIIMNFSREYNIPIDIVMSIYSIETTFRPNWFRLIEYLSLFKNILLRVIGIRKTLSNITIGKFQIGLGVIRQFTTGNVDSHERQLKLNKTEIFRLLSFCFGNKYYMVSVWWINLIHLEAMCLIKNENRSIRYIGTKYNGDISYGYLLEDLVKSRKISLYIS
ncbi:hypothetical protein J2Z32_002505 [Paenibacillus turicensis]|uniref:Uncharacterized protein n=1 Tax=Paenibacillus turicensis TaxID=160487 RepID=A0ABS4FTF3_9BACL|nr:hypothetical protein [Paenibacillus turicensis]MBP1905857.1 hypothetical protein [Paenibacillus turicensis]